MKKNARVFVKRVKELAGEYGLNVFVVTDGASGYSNLDNECVEFHRKKQILWEKQKGFDPYEDWSE